MSRLAYIFVGITLIAGRDTKGSDSFSMRPQIDADDLESSDSDGDSIFVPILCKKSYEHAREQNNNPALINLMSAARGGNVQAFRLVLACAGNDQPFCNRFSKMTLSYISSEHRVSDEAVAAMLEVVVDYIALQENSAHKNISLESDSEKLGEMICFPLLWAAQAEYPYDSHAEIMRDLVSLYKKA